MKENEANCWESQREAWGLMPPPVALGVPWADLNFSLAASACWAVDGQHEAGQAARAYSALAPDLAVVHLDH